jgi:hypothetical protein
MLCFHVLNSNLFLYVCLGDWFVNARQSFEFKRTGQGDYLKLSFQTPLTPMQTDTKMSHFQLWTRLNILGRGIWRHRDVVRQLWWWSYVDQIHNSWAFQGKHSLSLLRLRQSNKDSWGFFRAIIVRLRSCQRKMLIWPEMCWKNWIW